MRATGTPEQEVAILADLFAEDLPDWPEDLWFVFDDYQFAMEAAAPEAFVELLLRRVPLRLFVTSRRRPTWATARKLLYGEIYEIGRNELAMDRAEAGEVLAHRADAPAAGLVTLAEGWPAVIGLAALTDDFSLPESLPSTLHDYFAEELFQAAGPSTQRGLCLLAIAPSLNSAIAEFLLGESAKEVIREGVRLGFLTERSGGIELHPLLRTFLETKNKGHADVADPRHGLARYVAQRGAWDDAFTLVIHSFSEAVFVDLLESGLRDMLAAARLATLERWLDLAYQKHLDAGIVDLAQAEIAFHQGERTKGETLALRATRRFGDDHPLASRAFYIAGMSAHLDYHNERALLHCEAASARANSGGPWAQPGETWWSPWTWHCLPPATYSAI